MSEALERLARRVRDDPYFAAAPLSRVAESERLDDAGLAGRLGCTRRALRSLRLCRNPNPRPPHFGREVDRIAQHCGIDAGRLAETLRFGQALLAVRPAAAGVAVEAGSLLAARDFGALNSGGRADVGVPLWVTQLAAEFWEAAGVREPFPRGLRRPIARGLQMAVISMPGLDVGKVRQWLQENHLGCPCEEPDRAVRACLAARDGWGYVFLDGTDPEDEQRFSLAHELAHFLRHYWHPRLLASRRLGPQVLEVFDGLRSPTATERLHGLLANVPVGFHWHLMRRDAASPIESAVALAEEDADRLAYELLAPAAEVLASDRAVPLEQLLRDGFGLPSARAAAYAQLLVPAPAVDPLFLRLRGKT